MSKDYILRERDDVEFIRLKIQHQVWKDVSDLAIQKSQINRGEIVIDLGSGPGYLSYDLLKYIGKKGQIICLDNSDKFIDSIKNQKIKNLLSAKIDIRTDLNNFLSGIQKADKVFGGWILMFTGYVEKIINDIYTSLTPGGKFISIEYYDFRKISMFPESQIFDHIYANVYELLKNDGGDPDVGNKIPFIMEDVGFKNLELIPVIRTGKVGSALWHWLEMTNINHKNLVDANLIINEELDEFYEDWKIKSESNFSFITAPPLMITIGEK
jgi:precorrin-6B methylase 2